MTTFQGLNVPDIPFRPNLTSEQAGFELNDCTQVIHPAYLQVSGACAGTTCIECIFYRANCGRRQAYFDYLQQKKGNSMKEFNYKELRPGDFVLTQVNDREGCFFGVYSPTNEDEKLTCVGARVFDTEDNEADYTLGSYLGTKDHIGDVLLVIRPVDNPTIDGLLVYMTEARNDEIGFSDLGAALSDPEFSDSVIYCKAPEKDTYTVAEIEKMLKEVGKISKGSKLKIVKE